MPVKSQRLKVRDYSRGFTLVELMVSIAIFVVITGIIMVDQRRFGGNILITNLAYDVALGIRQAQVYGISVKSVNQQFNSSYGVHFGPPGYFILFADTNHSGSYDTSSDDGTGCIALTECVTFFKVEQGNAISKFCADNSCSDTGAIDRLDILFTRPNPEPAVKAYKGGLAIPASSASITVSSPQGVTKTVSVSPSGQISIKNRL